MKEKPILFNTEMVRAVLDGRKTQTRRVIKPQPNHQLEMCPYSGWAEMGDVGNGKTGCHCNGGKFKCPYGQVGNRLWVRERFCLGEIVSGDSLPEEIDPLYIEQPHGKGVVIPYEYAISQDIGIEDVKWKPSIFMRREYSRINLEIVDIRVERVMDITPEDALAEGIEAWVEKHQPIGDKRSIYPHSDFAFLWDSINKERGYGWDVNPWTWVVEFKVI